VITTILISVGALALGFLLGVLCGRGKPRLSVDLVEHLRAEHKRAPTPATRAALLHVRTLAAKMKKGI